MNSCKDPEKICKKTSFHTDSCFCIEHAKTSKFCSFKSCYTSIIPGNLFCSKHIHVLEDEKKYIKNKKEEEEIYSACEICRVAAASNYSKFCNLHSRECEICSFKKCNNPIRKGTWACCKSHKKSVYSLNCVECGKIVFHIDSIFCIDHAKNSRTCSFDFCTNSITKGTLFCKRHIFVLENKNRFLKKKELTKKSREIEMLKLEEDEEAEEDLKEEEEDDEEEEDLKEEINNTESNQIEYKFNIKNMEEYFNSPIFSDFCIEFEDNTKILVSKIILSIHSEKFKSLFNSGLKENKENILKISENKDIYTRFIQCLYAGKLVVEFKEIEDFIRLADEYLVTNLKKELEEKLCGLCNFKDIEKFVYLAYKYHLYNLRDNCIFILRNNLKETKVFDLIRNNIDLAVDVIYCDEIN